MNCHDMVSHTLRTYSSQSYTRSEHVCSVRLWVYWCSALLTGLFTSDDETLSSLESGSEGLADQSENISLSAGSIAVGTVEERGAAITVSSGDLKPPSLWSTRPLGHLSLDKQRGSKPPEGLWEMEAKCSECNTVCLLTSLVIHATADGRQVTERPVPTSTDRCGRRIFLFLLYGFVGWVRKRAERKKKDNIELISYFNCELSENHPLGV